MSNQDRTMRIYNPDGLPIQEATHLPPQLRIVGDDGISHEATYEGTPQTRSIEAWEASCDTPSQMGIRRAIDGWKRTIIQRLQSLMAYAVLPTKTVTFTSGRHFITTIKSDPPDIPDIDQFVHHK